MVKISQYNWLFNSLFIWCLILPIPSMSVEQDKKTPLSIEYYKNDNITNQIPYLDNRFRIDAQIDELTLLFYRNIGSKPIILIQPDGSKLNVETIDKERIEWFDDTRFDLIRIKKPMPGPWQAVGNILPNSKIMVVSDIKLQVEPLPQLLLSGETLKVKAQLFNGGQAITNPLFRHVIKLDIEFYSTNNASYDNFGQDKIQINSFRDDGYDLDEYSGDNVFTGEFVLDFMPGEWQPMYFIKLPMVTREIRQVPVILQKTPITLSVDMAKHVGDFHQVHFTIDKEFVDVDSLIFQGQTRFPDKQFKPFTINEGKGDKRTVEVEYTEPGIYRINVNAFGETINGREFRLVVDEFNFNVQKQKAIDINKGNANGEEIEGTLSETMEVFRANAKKRLAIKLAEAQQDFKEKEAAKQKDRLIYIVVGNVSILFIVLMGFIMVRWRKSKVKN